MSLVHVSNDSMEIVLCSLKAGMENRNVDTA